MQMLLWIVVCAHQNFRFLELNADVWLCITPILLTCSNRERVLTILPASSHITPCIYWNEDCVLQEDFLYVSVIYELFLVRNLKLVKGQPDYVPSAGGQNEENGFFFKFFLPTPRMNVTIHYIFVYLHHSCDALLLMWQYLTLLSERRCAWSQQMTCRLTTSPYLTVEITEKSQNTRRSNILSISTELLLKSEHKRGNNGTVRTS